MSYRQNYLDLDPTYKDANGLPLLRMTFDWHKNEQKMLAWMYERCAEIAKAMKPAKSHAHAIPAKYSIIPYQSTHNIGGAVMGADPATSAVNKYLQSWDVANVFVIGGSAIRDIEADEAAIRAIVEWVDERQVSFLLHLLHGREQVTFCLNHFATKGACGFHLCFHGRCRHNDGGRHADGGGRPGVDVENRRRGRHPTEPSIWSWMSRFISTAYSMGSSLTIGSMTPETIMAAASSLSIPRLWR